MANNYFELPPALKNNILMAAANKLNIPEIILEKDIWVCWVLDKLFTLPQQMSFKGGTSLSKAFNLIDRFSEDVDVTVDYRNFIGTINFKSISKSQLKKTSDTLKNHLQFFVSNIALPFIQQAAAKAFSGQKFKIIATPDGQSIQFYYPTSLTNKATNLTPNYLLDHVLIEFGVRNTTEPNEKRTIITLLSQALDSPLELPSATIDTLSPIRTFWEKATLIHVECHRGRLEQNPDRLSRHWYDLAMLANSWVGDMALKSSDILHDVLHHKKAFFNASYANYDECLANKFRLIPNDNEQKILETDMHKMWQSRMFQNGAPRFSEIIRDLSLLEQKINT